MTSPPATYTFMRNFENCPRKAWHINVARDLPKEEATDALKWGNEVHKAFEKTINKDIPLPPHMTEYRPFTVFRLGEVKAEVKLGVKEDGTPCDFFAGDVFARGVIDVLVTNANLPHLAIIIDHKTGSVREDDTELRFHACLLKANYPGIDMISGWYNWLKEKRAGQIHDLALGVLNTWLEIKAFKKKLDELIPLGSDAFPPRENPLCPWCPVKSCEFHP